MVFPGEAPRAVEVMTAATAASPSSHHSSQPHRSPALRVKPRSRLPQPPFRAWENHRLLRCVGADGAGTGAGGGVPATPATPSTSSPSAPGPGRRPAGPRDDGFERIRAKLMDHLREAAGRIELPSAASGDVRGKEPAAGAPVDGVADEDQGGDEYANPVSAASAATVSAAAAATGEELPWNLRTRRSTAAGAASSAPHHRGQPNSSSLAPSPAAAKPASRPRSGGPERREAAPRRRRPRFSVPLTKEEIDEDLYAFTGRRASRRPKKRPRALQKQLDMVFPGLWLSEVTVETYQVADPPPQPPPPS